MRRLPTLLVLTLVLALLAVTPVSAAPAPKVDVCHYDAAADAYHLINVSENAYQAHFDHGDQLAGASFLDETGMGWEFLDDCTLDHIYWMNYGPWYLSPQTVFDLGGAYDNDHVLNAIAEGYAGTLEFTEWATPEIVEFWLGFTNLAPGTTYQVFFVNDGGPFVLVGTFVADESGDGEFDYGPLTFAPGTELNYSFWVNENGFTVLKTDPDPDPPLSYTTH
jgi:hypothetical protein